MSETESKAGKPKERKNSETVKALKEMIKVRVGDTKNGVTCERKKGIEIN